ncbi:MAG: ATPase [Candidatus Altiarchaeales archaeon IMC4]|nr:MAG: ATPase [Candidatus Altiarchaeales archaeon IMC4]
MIKEDIISLLSEWNFWGKTPYTGVKRTAHLKKSLGFLGTRANKVLVITGLRRCGKSFFTKQITEGIISKGADPKDTLIVNFEEARFDEEISLGLLLRIYDAYIEIIRPRGKPLIVLDEIQEVPRWEKFVRTLQEKDEAKIIVTGSSSKLMSDELATLLTGRTLEIEFFPLDFREFLSFMGVEFAEYNDLIIKKKKIMEMLRQYLHFGGFPEVSLEDDEAVKNAILKKYYDDIISKDVVRRYNIRNIKKIETLANYYLSNVSSMITFNRVSKFLHLPLKTVEIYSKYLETSKLLFFVQRFSFSIKEQENSPRKVYSTDIGLMNAVSFRFMENSGRAYENLAAVELKRRGKDIYYWKDQQHREVDFVIKTGHAVGQLIQVCYEIENPETKERELKSLIKASKELRCNNLLVITEEFEGEDEFKGKTIKYLPLWKWLLT